MSLTEAAVVNPTDTATPIETSTETATATDIAIATEDPTLTEKPTDAPHDDGGDGDPDVTELPDTRGGPIGNTGSGFSWSLIVALVLLAGVVARFGLGWARGNPPDQ